MEYIIIIIVIVILKIIFWGFFCAWRAGAFRDQRQRESGIQRNPTVIRVIGQQNPQAAYPSPDYTDNSAIMNHAAPPGQSQAPGGDFYPPPNYAASMGYPGVTTINQPTPNIPKQAEAKVM